VNELTPAQIDHYRDLIRVVDAEEKLMFKWWELTPGGARHAAELITDDKVFVDTIWAKRKLQVSNET